MWKPWCVCLSQSHRIWPDMHCICKCSALCQREISHWKNEQRLWNNGGYFLSLRYANSHDLVITCFNQRFSQTGLTWILGSDNSGLQWHQLGFSAKWDKNEGPDVMGRDVWERVCVWQHFFRKLDSGLMISDAFRILLVILLIKPGCLPAGWGSDNAYPHCYVVSCGLDIEHLYCFEWDRL